MADIRNLIHTETVGELDEFSSALKRSLNYLRAHENDITAIGLHESCRTLKWNEEEIDRLHNMLYMLSEPRRSSDICHSSLKELRSRLHDIYSRQMMCCQC